MKRAIFFSVLCAFALFAGGDAFAQAAAQPAVSINLGTGEGLTARVLQLTALITVLSLAPSILIMTTSFVRIVVVLSFLAVYVVRALRAGMARRDSPFRTLLAVGLGLLIGVQALLIMGGVLKLVPLTGVTLPFLSYGGSSLVTSFLITGLLLRVSAPDG